MRVFTREDAVLRIAAGFALGSCVNFLPTMGLGIPIAVAVAFVSRTNVVAAVVGETLFKPLFPLMLYLNFKVGAVLTGENWSETLSWPPESPRLVLETCLAYSKVFIVGLVANSLVWGAVLVGVLWLCLSRYRHRIINWLSTREEDIG